MYINIYIHDISFWRHSLEHSKKLEFYKAFKDEYFTSDYLNQPRNVKERRNLVKFRMSNHKLIIELDRSQTDHVPRKSKSCPLCKSNQVEMKIISCCNVAILFAEGDIPKSNQ